MEAMEDSKNVDTGAGQVDTATDDNTINNDNDTADMVTMSKVEYDKAIQAAEDRVRGKLSREIKELKAQLPVQKSDADIAYETKLAEIETKQLEIEAKEKDLAFRAALQEANLDKSIADFVRADVDVNALCATIDKVVNAKIADKGYMPSGNHANNMGITKEQWNNLDYTEMEKLYKSNPEIVKKFMGK